MLRHARWLFVSAAVFNWSVALGLLLLEPFLRPLLGLDVASGSNLALRDLGLALIISFGCAYFCIALNPVRFRPYIGLGILAKSLVLVAIYSHWLAGHIGWQLPALAVGDAVYSLLFLQFLRRIPA